LPAEPFLTTHQAASLLGVSLSSVAKWVDAGRIRAHRTPGGHRRIARSEVERFAEGLKQEGEEDFGLPCLLLVVKDPELRELIGEFLQARSGRRVHRAADPFQAGYLICRHTPAEVLVDLRKANTETLRMPGELELLLEEAARPRWLALIDPLHVEVGRQALSSGFTAAIPYNGVLDSVWAAVQRPAP
jgi:excisionase family DNA binding protein